MARDPNASYEGKNQRTPISIKQMQEQIKELQTQFKAAQDTITQLNSDFSKRVGSITAFSVTDNRYVYLYPSTSLWGTGIFITNQNGRCLINFKGAVNPTVIDIESGNTITASYDSTNKRFIIDSGKIYSHWLVILGGNIGRTLFSYRSANE